DLLHPWFPWSLGGPGAVHRVDLDTLPRQSQRTLELKPPARCTADHIEQECRPCGVEGSEALSLCLEVDVVCGQAAPVIYLPGEDPGSGTYTRVAATGQGPLGKHRRALEVAGMFRSSPGGVEPARAGIVTVAELGSALECSPSRP